MIPLDGIVRGNRGDSILIRNKRHFVEIYLGEIIVISLYLKAQVNY